MDHAEEMAKSAEKLIMEINTLFEYISLKEKAQLAISKDQIQKRIDETAKGFAHSCRILNNNIHDFRREKNILNDHH